MDRKFLTTEEKVQAYESVVTVFAELFKELKELSKKKPEATLSTSKIKIINRVLDDVRQALNSEPDAKYLDILDDSELPQYGDAILILSQYEGALKAFRDRHRAFTKEAGTIAWLIRKPSPEKDKS